MLRLTLLAHAATEAQRQMRFTLDEGIEPVDEPSLERLAATLTRRDTVWCGPERRVLETAGALGLSATVCPELRNWSAGVWAGQSIAEIIQRQPEAMRRWRSDSDFAPEGGESLTALLDRVGRWMDGQPEEPRRDIVLADPAVIRAAIVHALGAPAESFWHIDVEPLSRSVVQRTNGDWRLRSLNSS